VPARDILTWNRFVPRLGLSWDVRGTGHSVVKATPAVVARIVVEDVGPERPASMVRELSDS
jgi:hypothetical protein